MDKFWIRSLQGPRASHPGGKQIGGMMAARAKAYEEDLRQGNGKGIGQSWRKLQPSQPEETTARGSHDE